jgi:hypothetical protein
MRNLRLRKKICYCAPVVLASIKSTRKQIDVFTCFTRGGGDIWNINSARHLFVIHTALLDSIAEVCLGLWSSLPDLQT